ncbi:MAG TPA: M20/M25/M40 family metallo-hydrolase [Phycisphaerales bacterium]|nr:M20/M25/M40 family metallo-hydrolase [Phycisphaerales bacterium]
MAKSTSVNTDLLIDLCATPGVPGREERVRALIQKEIKGLFDETRVDNMGNLICRRAATKKPGGKGKPTRVLLLCHMDEIGFYVKGIDDQGFIRVNNAGGFDTRNLFSRRVLVCTDDGDLPGVMNPGGRPIHIASEEDKKKIPEVKEFMVDIGLPAAKVKKAVKVGDYVVMNEPPMLVGEKFVSKACDNRVACWLGIESVRAIDAGKASHACDLYVVFTVQEEVGLRGAHTASFGVEPDIAIGLDVTLACDTPGVPADEMVTKHGDGCGLHIMDSSFISDYRLINDLEAVATKNGIKHQRTILGRGGQDGAAGQQARSGARAAGIVVGTRYIHTVTEMIDLGDLAAARDLLAAWIPTV